jgi:hypothetical protein
MWEKNDAEKAVVDAVGSGSGRRAWHGIHPRARWVAGAAMALAMQQSAAAAPSEDELAALKEWSREISGAVVYTHDGRIHKVSIGNPEPVDLGPGAYARWSPDGARLAVYRRGVVSVMNADGTDRRELVSGASQRDGSPIEFHPNGEEIVYWKKESGFHAVNISTGSSRKLNAPGVYSGEPGLSADGSKMAARWDNDLYVIDLTAGTHRKYARGCSPGVSPSGELVMNNVGEHKELVIRNWNGAETIRLDARNCRPDRQWDGHHWSNHEDFIAAEGERRGNNVYVVNVRENKGLRVTWEEGSSPDAFIVAERAAATTNVASRATPTPLPQAQPPAAFRSDSQWPGDHTGLIFLWENAGAANEVLDKAGKPARMCRLVPQGTARFGRHFDLEPAGGAFLADGADAALLDACRESGELTIELVLTPGDPALSQSHERGRVVTFSRGTHDRNFTLNQFGNELQIHMNTRQRQGGASMVALDRLSAGQTAHVIVTYRDSELVYYRNGREVARSDAIRGDFSNWRSASLAIGNERTGDREWAGNIEGIAIYSRFIPPGEAARKFQLYTPKLSRNPAARTALNGVLLQTTAVPDPASIEPYRRALVVNTFEIDDPARLKSSDGKIQVAQWGVLDGRRVPSIEKLRIGTSYRLVIEPFEDHPQLESERLVSDSEAFDIPLYYDLRAPQSDEGAAGKLTSRNVAFEEEFEIIASLDLWTASEEARMWLRETPLASQ